jgi:hypothetical protein
LGNKHAEYLVKLARQLCTTPGVHAMFVYELLEEPHFGSDTPESRDLSEASPQTNWRLVLGSGQTAPERRKEADCAEA